MNALPAIGNHHTDSIVIILYNKRIAQKPVNEPCSIEIGGLVTRRR